ncbi:TonB-dependent receptor domain-containing protein [uncultured Paludibaculum sp.]|uniref:TonB-dependent receptor n=1 Tax=uncultured Paludibaculum sp. TaxID=1765020 RepID=UPI002AAB477A|nr:TonB-dependent receptor [uncultured Paludibaculum sp.]
MYRFAWILALVGTVAAQTPPTDSKPKEETPALPVLHQSVVVVGTPVEVTIDRRNGEVVQKTLFSRDDQIFHILDAGINAGQHEGGAKSVEIRRFGFNLDHGGVSGGLKVLTDGVGQNQSTQGHGQGYLGSLKSLSPELIKEVNLINGPFSAEYGDFSGLGVVHILTRDTMPDELTFRMQGGSYDTARGFFSYSPTLQKTDALFAYEGSFSNGPFIHPLGYRRDNVTANVTRRIDDRRQVALKFNAGRADSYSSGQLPVDQIESGRLNPFDAVNPTNGIRQWNGTLAGYWRQEGDNGQVWKVDAFVGRSLFDHFMDFTFYLNDPVNGDAFQQHDSRLQQGANVQYLRPHKLFGMTGYLSTGANFHANQINVGLYPRVDRVPVGVATRSHADITNGAGYVQENFSLLQGKLLLGAGLRFDEFRFDLADKVDPLSSGVRNAGRWQPKASASFTPTHRLPVTLFANYGRGISTSDARAIVKNPDMERVATTDFSQSGIAVRTGRFAAQVAGFYIARSNEQVYIPDDGTIEFKGPSRSYGFETKASAEINRFVSLNGGITKVTNAFYLGEPRVYVDSAPHFVANAGVTLSGWKNWSGSLRMRAIDHYRLDGEDPSILASGNTVFDLWISRRMSRNIDLHLGVDNLMDRSYYETQNYFESRLQGEEPMYRVHATPGYGRTITVGMTLKLRRK